MIHVAYRLGGGDGFYAKMLGTSMLSMFENTKEKITVHVMHNDTLTLDNRGKFCYIAGQYNQKIEFHHAEEIAAESLRKIREACPTISQRFSNSVWYLFVVHEIFPNLDKLIIIGADTIINLDINELWQYDLSNESCGIAATPEFFNGTSKNALKLVLDGYVRHEDYINSDVLLLKPKFIMENFERLLEGCRFIFQKYPYLDQDVLNYLFSKDILKLPRKFNAMIMRIRKNPSVGKEIYHFAGPKPDLNTDDVYNKLYLEYFLKTPWATADMFGNIDKAFRRQYDRLKTEFLRYTNLLYNRERLFLIDKNMTDKMRKIFAIRDDETIIDASDSAAMEKFFETLDELKGKKLIYLLSNNFKPVEDRLHKRDFLGGRDYVNALIFLSEKDGGRWLVYDPKAVVREM